MISLQMQAYQERAMQYAEYEDGMYPFLALAEEVGEFLGILAKIQRGDDMQTRYGSLQAIDEALLKEAGDVLWQLTASLKELGFTLEQAAQMNLVKLEDRAKRGVIKGTGDSR